MQVFYPIYDPMVLVCHKGKSTYLAVNHAPPMMEIILTAHWGHAANTYKYHHDQHKSVMGTDVFIALPTGQRRTLGAWLMIIKES